MPFLFVISVHFNRSQAGFSAPARQYPNLPDAHAHVERRHHIRTMRGSTTNDYSDWHQHPSSERQLIFLLPTSTSQPRPTTDRRQHISNSWTPSAGSFFYGTTGRAQFQAPPSRPMLHTLCVRCGLAARERAPRQVLTSAQVPPSALTRTRTRARYLHRVAHQTFSSALQAPTLRTAR